MGSLPKKVFYLPGYNLVRILGHGAASTIWEVKCIETGRTFAVKRVCRASKSDQRFVDQIKNEYQIASKISHSNIRKVYNLRIVRRLFVVSEVHMLMEYCPGVSVADNRPTDILEACGIFAQVANAMQAMNEAGFVHADMKPNNIIVDDNGNAKIIDLGQCCPIGTIKKRIQGTPDYIAPEQVRRFPLDARTDVYNFGASLYWTLTGKPIPTILAKPGSMTVPGQNAMATPPEKLNADVPPLLSRLILDCIRLQPVERPASMREVSMRLGLILQKLLVPAS